MTDSQTPAKKGGRPAKYPGEGKRPTITFRCRPSLQEKLQSSAEGGDRSLSEEIERRLDKSFIDADLLSAVGEAVRQQTNAGIEQLVGGKDNLDLLIRLSHGIVLEQIHTGKRWTEDAETRDRVYKSICNSLPFILHNPSPDLGSATDQVERFRARKADILSRVDPEE